MNISHSRCPSPSSSIGDPGPLWCQAGGKMSHCFEVLSAQLAVKFNSTTGAGTLAPLVALGAASGVLASASSYHWHWQCSLQTLWLPLELVSSVLLLL